jgi:hypothetical protein
VKGGIGMKEKKQKKTSEDLELLVEAPEAEKAGKKTKEKAPKVKKVKQVSAEKKEKNRLKWTSKYFKKFSGRHQDNYDEMLQEDYDKVVSRAHELSSISEADYDALILITVPDAFEKNGRVTYRLDKKADGTHTLLYDQALVTALFFGEDTLYYHQANVDHRNGHIGFDVAGEFSYFDVVHMETSLKYDNNDHPKYITLDLEIGLSDGTITPFHLRNHRIHDDYDLHGLLTPTEQKVLDTIKKKVRSSRKI